MQYTVQSFEVIAGTLAAHTCLQQITTTSHDFKDT